MTPTILLLDDDPSFRGLLARILRPTGYVVVEAETSAEALEALSHIDQLALAVVDFTLPDGNGISFITQLRENWRSVPVVFLSASPLDRESFTYLRNILRVSLVLQKPIQPELFVLQIDSLLPPLRQGERSATGKSTIPMPQVAVSRMHDNYVPGNTHDPHQSIQAQEMQNKLANDAAIRHAQSEMAANLPYEWETLARLLQEFQHDPHNSRLRTAVITLAREIRRTAGSFGLSAVVQAAGKIDGYTTLLDPSDLSGHEILWLEIFRSLAEGETALRSITDLSSEAASQEPVQAGHVLLLGGAQTLSRPEADIKPSVDARITFSNAPVQAVTKAASTHFDAAILDVATFGRRAIFSAAGELRATEKNGALPLAFVMPSGDRLSDVERVYYGCSVALTAPVGQKQFEECLLDLAGKNQSTHARVLAVDDDRVLTTLIERVLGNYGMTVHSLNQAINIFDALENSRPDVVLLDVVMPGLSGYDICRMIRESEKWKHLPIIFLTSKSDAQGRAAAFQAGANDFLAKPILSEELLLRVKMQLQRARADREQGSVDDATGLLAERSFLTRAQETFIDAGRSSQDFSLCFFEIKNFESYEQYGTFATMSIVTSFSKLLRSRFAADVLRGKRHESGFALAIRKEEPRIVEAAVTMLTKEFSQMRFTGIDGRQFSAQILASVASSPTHGMSISALADAAQKQLERSPIFPSGHQSDVTFR